MLPGLGYVIFERLTFGGMLRTLRAIEFGRGWTSAKQKARLLTLYLSHSIFPLTFMLDKIFVYGTLLQQIGNMMASFLKSNSEFLGEAVMPGKLYKVDFYPGAVYEPGATSKVVGEVYRLKDVAKVLEVLDTYEGYEPNDEERSLFLRREVEVISSEETLNAWTYLYHASLEDLPLIPSGDFLQYQVNRYQ